MMAETCMEAFSGSLDFSCENHASQRQGRATIWVALLYRQYTEKIL